jgi:hypothetical protein
MTIRCATLILKSTAGVLRLTLLSTLVLIAPILAVANDSGHEHAAPARLVQIVRANTTQFINVNNAAGAGYAPAFGCVSGPDHGAMGIHYLNGSLIGDGDINAKYPEALIYEPVGN